MPAKTKEPEEKTGGNGTGGDSAEGRGPARSIWKGAISFGMVAIPVKLFPATGSKDIAFNMIHTECNSRIRMLRWCPVCEREVKMDEISKGYQYAKDQYVLLDPEDFQKVPVPSKHTIELSAFVDAAEIDPLYYEKSYYLQPDTAGKKSFALLYKILTEKKQTAVAKIAIRE